MSIHRSMYLALAATFLLSSSALTIERRDGKPNFPYDEKTTKDCTWWIDYDGTQECAPMLEENLATLESFRRWNPTIGPNCSGLTAGKSYCVEALFEAPPGETTTAPTTSATPTPTSKTSSKASSSPVKPTASSSAAPTSKSFLPSSSPTPKPSSKTPTTSAAPSSTKPAGNGIETPLPTQPEIVSNCDQFYWVVSGEQCADIASRFGITLAKFLAWNPKAGNSCAGLWAEAYACVSIIGEVASPVATPTPTPTNPGNGIATPQPPQPNMVSNCDKFVWVNKGDQCASIASANGISLAQFQTWNPSAGSNCGGLWAEAYACVSVVGHTPSTPTPTPTKPPNGVQTPSPTQPGMTTSCKKFDFVKKGEICDTIIKRNGISLSNFTKWNSAVGSDCRSMWAETYVCVGV